MSNAVTNVSVKLIHEQNHQARADVRELTLNIWFCVYRRFINVLSPFAEFNHRAFNVIT